MILLLMISKNLYWFINCSESVGLFRIDTISTAYTYSFYDYQGKTEFDFVVRLFDSNCYCRLVWI